MQDIVKKSLITEEETWFLQKVKRERKKKDIVKKSLITEEETWFLQKVKRERKDRKRTGESDH